MNTRHFSPLFYAFILYFLPQSNSRGFRQFGVLCVIANFVRGASPLHSGHPSVPQSVFEGMVLSKCGSVMRHF